MFRKRSLIAGVLLAMLPASGSIAQGGVNPVSQSNVPNLPGGQALAVGRMVRGILSFTRWPAAPPTIRLCVTGATRFAGAFAGGGLAVRQVTPAVRAEECDAVYLGPMPDAARAALLARLRGRPVVTIDEADPQCRVGAMFCFRIGAGQIGMDLNIDAVSRSGVRIDPRVLRLTRPAGAGR